MTHLSLRSFAKSPMASISNIQTAPSSPSSSCPESQWEYEVFLNFGGDTRNTFTDHLYHALAFDKGIITFGANVGLDRGKPISPEVLLKAIEKSRKAVVIFSENYASSPLCLEELVKIVECMNKGRMRVYPIFYHIEPSHVRHQKGAFKDAFAEHDERFKEKVQTWREALKSVADLSGYHMKDE
ncbi:hypothetical protein SLA2020_437500 [Shorea laevis]